MSSGKANECETVKFGFRKKEKYKNQKSRREYYRRFDQFFISGSCVDVVGKNENGVISEMHRSFEIELTQDELFTIFRRAIELDFVRVSEFLSQVANLEEMKGLCEQLVKQINSLLVMPAPSDSKSR